MAASDDDFDIRPKKKRREDPDLDITPMIDITFLLLAFFVMVSKMDPQMAVKLPEAKFGSNIPEKNCVVLVVIPSENDESVFQIFKGRSKDEADLVTGVEDTDKELEIADFVESEFSKRPTLEAVLIKGEGTVKTGIIEVVKRGVGKSELARTRKLYVGVEDK